jgi:hypothetical protein
VDEETGEIIDGDFTEEAQEKPANAPALKQEAPQTASPTTTGPTTIPDLLKRAYDEYGLQPPDVAKEAAVESTARITDVPRVWAQIVARGKQPALK